MRPLLSRRGLIVGVVAGLLVASSGLALGRDSGTPEGSTAVASGSPSDPSPPFTGPESLGFVPEQEWRESHGLPPLSEKDEVDFAAEGPIPWIAESCRKEGAGAVVSTPLHCDAIIAVTEGRLAPGAYSDEQLRAELHE